MSTVGGSLRTKNVIATECFTVIVVHRTNKELNILVQWLKQDRKVACPVLWAHVLCLSLQGTVLSYQPGLLYGGSVEHDCNTQRSIGYYLEALLMLAPFMKTSLKATLRGVTNDPTDPTVRTHVHASDHLLTVPFRFLILFLLNTLDGAVARFCKEMCHRFNMVNF